MVYLLKLQAVPSIVRQRGMVVRVVAASGERGRGRDRKAVP